MSSSLAFWLFVVAIDVIYAFIASAGTFKDWPAYTFFYDLLADGFLKGQLHVPIDPPKALLEKANPYDPRWQPLWYWDITLYNGRYYLYWGPFPALIQSVVKGVLGIKRQIGDQYLVFLFLSIQLFAGAALLKRIWQRVFPGLSRFHLWLATLVFGLANPHLFMLAAAGVYQAAIAGGQACVVLGLLLAFEAVWRAGSVGAGFRYLIGTGVCWALAVACRVSLGPSIFVLSLLLTFVVVWGTPRPTSRWLLAIKGYVAVALPVALGVGILLLYNKARFDSFFDFGTANQLSTMKFRTSPGYLSLNLWSYLIRPLTLSCSFPFITAPWGGQMHDLPTWLEPKLDYWTREPVAGLLLTTPWAWLTPLAVFGALPLLRRAERLPGELARSGRLRALLFCTGAFSTMAAVNGLPEILLFIATMRYLHDVIPGMILLATLGAWALASHARAKRSSRWLANAACALFGVVTITAGFLLGIQGYNDQFKTKNPALFKKAVANLSLCTLVGPDKTPPP